MNSKTLYLKIILRVILMMSTALLFAFAELQDHLYYSIFLGLLIAFQVISLIKFLNRTNRKIAYFFEAIENDDSTLYYPVHLKNPSLNTLHENLNRVNKLIQDIKIEHEVQENYFQRILEEASIGILTVSEQGHVFTANKHAKTMLGRNQLNHVSQLKQVAPKIFGLISRLKPFEPEVIEVTNEREVIKISVKATALVLKQKELLLVIIQNINSEIEHSEVDSWNKLFSVLTHEIMNTVAPITSLAEALVTKIALLSPDRKSGDVSTIESISKGLNIIENNSKNLFEFVNSYRALTGIPSPDKAFFSVATLFDKIKILCSQDKGFNQVTFKIDVSNDLVLFGDEKQLIQVLINLVKNALQSLGGTTDGIISLEGKKDGSGKTILRVGDNGPGIPAASIQKIFIPFFTTKNEGTGIGLSLSKHIMRLHGGTIQVSSDPYTATVFTLNFPV